MRTRTLILMGGMAFLAGALTLFPARVAYEWFAPPELRLAGLGGTVWQGNAAHASLNGLYVKDLDWTLKPLALVTGRIAARLSGEPEAGFFEGDVSISAGGKLIASDANASLSLDSVGPMLNLPNLSGAATLRLQRLEIVDGLPVAATGTVTVADLFAPTIYEGSVIGGYQAEFFTQDDGIAASVEDTDGVLDLAGSLTLGSDRNYSFVGQLAPKPGIDAGLQNRLRFLGNPNDRGQYELRLEGQL